MFKKIMLFLIILTSSFSILGCSKDDTGYSNLDLNEAIINDVNRISYSTMHQFNLVGLYSQTDNIIEGFITDNPKLICGYVDEETYNEYSIAYNVYGYDQFVNDYDTAHDEKYFGVNSDLKKYVWKYQTEYLFLYNQDDLNYAFDTKHPIRFYDFTDKTIPVVYQKQKLIVVFYELEMTLNDGTKAYILIHNQGEIKDGFYNLDNAFIENEYLLKLKGAKFLTNKTYWDKIDKYITAYEFENYYHLIQVIDNKEVLVFNTNSNVEENSIIHNFLTNSETCLLKQETIIDDKNNEVLSFYYDYQKMKSLYGIN